MLGRLTGWIPTRSFWELTSGKLQLSLPQTKLVKFRTRMRQISTTLSIQYRHDKSEAGADSPKREAEHDRPFEDGTPPRIYIETVSLCWETPKSYNSNNQLS